VRTARPDEGIFIRARDWINTAILREPDLDPSVGELLLRLRPEALVIEYLMG
jgi:hypothetical protein